MAGLSPVIAGELGIASTFIEFAVACPGKKFSADARVAAHRTLPCGSLALVRNLKTKQSVVVEIIDRGPHRDGRVIDLSPLAAREIGSDGLAQVEVTPITGFQALWRQRIGIGVSD
jgi:rare lipoprotein A